MAAKKVNIRIILILFALAIAISSVQAYVSVSGNCSTTCTITSPYYIVSMDDGVIINQYWLRQDNVKIDSSGSNNFPGVFDGIWRTGTTEESTCTYSSSNYEYDSLAISCSNAYAYMNWTFYSSYYYIDTASLTASTWRMYHYLSSWNSSKTIAMYNSTAKQSMKKAWQDAEDANGLVGYQQYNDSSYVMIWDWNQSASTDFAYGNNASSWGGIAIGYTDMPAAQPMQVYYKSVPINTSATGDAKVTDVMTVFTSNRLYGDDYNDIRFSSPTPAASANTLNGIYINTSAEYVENFSAMIDIAASNRLMYNWITCTSAGACSDNSTFGTAGTMTGFTTNVSYAGIRGNYLILDGVNDNVVTSGVSQLTGSQTVTAWINATTTTTANYTIVTSDGLWANYTHMFTQITPNQMLAFGVNTGSQAITCYANNTNITYGEWTHVAGSYDGTSIKLYKNGVLERTCNSSTWNTTTSSRKTSSYRQGGNGGSGKTWFKGMLGPVRTDTRTLTDAEIAADYDASINPLYLNYTVAAGTYSVTIKALGANGGPVDVATRSFNVYNDSSAPNTFLFTATSPTNKFNSTLTATFKSTEVGSTNISSYRVLFGNGTTWYSNTSYTAAGNGFYTQEQEAADSYTGTCGALMDSNYGSCEPKPFCYINYTKPTGASSASWYILDELGSSTVTLASTSFNYFADYIYLLADEPSYSCYWYTYNGGWVNVRTGCYTAESEMCEEKVTWTINGITGSNTTAIPYTRGQQMCTQIEVTDYYGNVATNQSCFNVSNTAPVLVSAAISPSPASEIQNLNCTYVATDADNDTILVQAYNWTVNGNASAFHTQILGVGNYTGTDTVACSVIVNDSYDSSSWISAPGITLDDTAPPVIYQAYVDSYSVKTDEVHTITVNCSDPEGTGIAGGYPRFSYVSPASVTQGNYTMSLRTNTTDIFDYALTFSQVGTYTDFFFYCMDAQNNMQSNTTANLTVSSSVRVVDIPATGGGGVPTSVPALKNCNWSVSDSIVTFYEGESVKQLFIYNRENFSISPVYSISNANFKVAGAKSLMIAQTVQELTIVKEKTNASVQNITATLSISSANCKPINMTVMYINDYEQLQFTDVANNIFGLIGNKLTSTVNVAGFGVGFYWIILVLIIIVGLIVSAADASIGVKFGAGFMMVLLLGVLLGAVVPTTDIVGKITPDKLLNSTMPLSEQHLTVVDNTAAKTSESSTFMASMLDASVANTDIGFGAFNVTYWMISILIFLIATGIFFAVDRFDWWANTLLGFFISIIITVIAYALIGTV